ncbi:SDR family NAD(P)-dependent oxidoreductase [Streptomyces sp. NPDC059076]|uniref:SDR family NAD(P)-dependent oxidoreductase n=1 Tax=unclassified Streptomyces TaxID=2593676 RepID=UPI003674F22E
MRTYVITGGSDGIGRGLGLHLLGRGERVIAIASGAAKGATFLTDAARIDAADRAFFLQADLSTLAGMHRAIEATETISTVIDGLVLGAQRFQPRRVETVDGLEFTFALAYLSRFVLARGLLAALERSAATPVIMNISSPGGPSGAVHWDDLQLNRRYKGMRAALQSARCNDLLGADFPVRHPAARTRYVLHNPGFVRTSQPESFPEPMRTLSKAVARWFATSVDRAILPMVERLDQPPVAPFSAFLRAGRLPLTTKAFAPESAARLESLTSSILAPKT